MLVKLDHLPTIVIETTQKKNTHKPRPKTTNPKTECWLANAGFTYLTQTSSQEQVAGVNPAFSPTEITKNHVVFVERSFVTSDSTAWLMTGYF